MTPVTGAGGRRYQSSFVVDEKNVVAAYNLEVLRS